MKKKWKGTAPVLKETWEPFEVCIKAQYKHLGAYLGPCADLAFKGCSTQGKENFARHAVWSCFHQTQPHLVLRIFDFPDWSFLGCSSGKKKKPACQYRRRKRRRFNPWIRKIPWRWAWHPTPVFLPGESHGQRTLTKSQTRLKQLSTHTQHPWLRVSLIGRYTWLSPEV